MHRLKTLSKIHLAFMAMSVLLVIAFLVFYIPEVRQALAMDPNSYECKYDSMMRQLCGHPYSTSIFWAGLPLVFFGWPALVIWLILGIIVAVRSVSKLANRPHK